MNQAQKVILHLVIFLVGLCVMVFELIAPRVYAPFLGTSSYIWTIVIGVVMASLSVGYFIGGKLSSNKYDVTILSLIIFASGILVLVFSLTKDILLVSTMGPDKNVILRALSISTIMLGPVNILLGMVTPISIATLVKHKIDAGKIAGNVFATSTLGSIIGTFVAGLWLIPTMGVHTILFLVSLILMLSGTLMAASNKTKLFMIISTIILSSGFMYINPKKIFSDYFKKIYHADIVADFNTRYDRVWIYDLFGDTETLRILSNSQSERRIHQSVQEDLENNINYLKFNEVAGYYLEKINNTLLIGGGAYTYPAYVSQVHPETHMDVVEIDPELINVAKKYFGYKESEQIKSYAMDGRVFLNDNSKKYDVIYLNAYRNGDAIPFQLATFEAYGKMFNSLNDKGILIVNIIGAMEGEDSRLFQSQVKTIAEIFDIVKVFPVTTKDLYKRQNLIVVAIKGITKVSPEPTGWMKQILSTEIDYSNKAKPHWQVMTDNFAPLEYYDLQHYF